MNLDNTLAEQMRHPITGRYMAGDCERDCLEHCAGLCGVAMSDAVDWVYDPDEAYPELSDSEEAAEELTWD